MTGDGTLAVALREQVAALAPVEALAKLAPVARAIRELEDSALAARAGEHSDAVYALEAEQPAPVIQSAEEANAVGEHRQKVAALYRQIVAALDPVRAERYAAWKTANNMQNAMLQRLMNLDLECKNALDEWMNAEQARVDRERLAAEEAARKAAAAAARAEGDARMAKKIENGKVAVPVAEIAAPAAVAGTEMREVWVAECTDKAAFVRACADGVEPTSLDWVEVKMEKPSALVRNSKGAIRIPGITARREMQAARAPARGWR